MELPDGVYAFPQTVARDGSEHTIHPAAVNTEKGLLIVDTGYERAIDQLEAHLADAGFDWSDVRGLLLTHQDGDHAGAASAIVERTDAVVYAHERCAPYVDGREHPIKAPPGERYPPTAVDVELVDGVTFRTAAGPMEAVFTPGHAPGHLSLYFPDGGLLLAADALTADADGLAGPSEQFTLDMPEALDSADRLSERDINRILCYHGGPIAADSSDIRSVVEALR